MKSEENLVYLNKFLPLDTRSIFEILYMSQMFDESTTWMDTFVITF